MPRTSGLKVWADRRSGPVGCLAGNAVLAVLQEREKEDVFHEKGTVFGTSSKILVCRMCSSDKYLQKGIVHFCNMSMQQHDQVMKEDREVFYLFITVKNGEVHFWLIPGKTIGTVLPAMSSKPDGTTRFLRITEKDGRHYLAGRNISSYHEVISLKPSDLAKVSKERRRLTNEPSFRVLDDGQVEVEMNIRGKQFAGVLTPQ